jgi:hypothetical protein
MDAAFDMAPVPAFATSGIDVLELDTRVVRDIALTFMSQVMCFTLSPNVCAHGWVYGKMNT